MALTIGSPEMENMMRSGKYSDLNISCQGILFRVHKLVVCPQSEKIKDEVSSGSQSDVIVMDKFSLGVVNRFVQFLYMGMYKEHVDDEVPQPPTVDSETRVTQNSSFEAIALNHICMNAIGHAYGVESLSRHASDRLKVLLGKDDGLDVDQVTCLPIIFEEARKVAGDTRVRDIMARVAAVNIKALMAMDLFKQQPYMTAFPLELVKTLIQINEKVSEKSSKQVTNLKAGLESLKEKQHSAIENERSRLSAELHNDKVKLQATLAIEKTKLQSQLESEKQRAVSEAEDAAMKHYQELQDQKTKFEIQLESERTKFRTETENAVVRHRSELQQEKAKSNAQGLQGDITRLRSQVESSRARENQLRAELKVANDEISGYEDAVSALAGVDTCRNQSCYYDDFGCVVDTPNPQFSSYPFILRCTNCGCKHPGG